jgi:dihydroflavonol-4-reductase
MLAASGHLVRGLTRRNPDVRDGDPSIAWHFGDLRDPSVRATAITGMRAVVHTASWVSLASDPSGQSASTNVDATRALIEDCAAAGVERFVYTSTLHTLAAGSAEHPADEDSPWNLQRVESPYARTKREAERVVLDGLGGRLPTVALCPGMVLGPRDERPTSTRVLLALSRTRWAFVPDGGIPVLDAVVAARAHRAALTLGEPGQRYAVVGPYVSYSDLAGLVGRVAGRPRSVRTLHDRWQRPLTLLAGRVDRWSRGRWIDFSAASMAGAFLRLHVRGDRADSAFGLTHPDPSESIRAALVDAREQGRAPWLPKTVSVVAIRPRNASRG